MNFQENRFGNQHTMQFTYAKTNLSKWCTQTLNSTMSGSITNVQMVTLYIVHTMGCGSCSVVCGGGSMTYWWILTFQYLIL